MDNNIFNEINSTLDLNGPILSFSEQPTGATGIGTTVGATGGASVSFTGIATGVDPGTGYLSYQWYEQDVGKLSDSTYVTGTASTGPVGTAATLTISNLITPRDNQRKFYVVADYVASAYGGGNTGNAWNEPLTSGIGTAEVTPLIEIVAQRPEGRQALVDQNTSISVDADLTDSYFADDLQYQWYLNGELAEDGVKTVTVTTSSSESNQVEYNYTDPASHRIPSTATDLEVIIAGAAGGNGGLDGNGPGGQGGSGSVGRFSLTAPIAQGETIEFRIGHKGNDGTSGGIYAWGEGGQVVDQFGGSGGSGYRGGRAGARGWSGGGGGGGAASFVLYASYSSGVDGNTIICAGGGGGGGGCAHNVGGLDASPRGDGKYFKGQDYPLGMDYRQGAFAKPGEISPGWQTNEVGTFEFPWSGNMDGGGGGGGGGGCPGWEPGTRTPDNSAPNTGERASSGVSAYNTNSATQIGNHWLNNGNGYANFKYTSTTTTEITTVKKTTLSGTTSNILTISADYVGVQTCQCKITSATASNSPIWTDVTNFVTTTTADQNNIHVEAIGVGITASLSGINLSNGDYTFYTTNSQVSSGSITKYYSFYSPDKDIDVEMDLYGGKGDDKGSYTGGEGGYSRIRFTMNKNEEYMIVGLSSDLNAPFLYRKGELMACVGQGGDAGTSGDGGNGGGVTNEGEGGGGRESGIGGVGVAEGTLGANGTFGSQYPAGTVYGGDIQATGQDGGRTIRCAKGVFWAQQGIAACTDITDSRWYGPGGVGPRFRLPDGTDVTNSSSSITRGYKAGYNIMETGGAKDSNGGRGGNGATGGSGGSQGGGGGGSGYNDGSITVIDTQQGGSTEDAKVVLRVVS